MRFWSGITDNAWYEYLAGRNPDEVNFWQPGGRPPFSGLPVGAPFLFKLKRPHNHIAGGGFFLKFTTLPVSMAWDAFGEKNGAPDVESLEQLILPLRSATSAPGFEIGCTILTEPFFFPRSDWIPAPGDMSRNIVVGKTYDTADESGARLLAEVELRLGAIHKQPAVIAETRDRYGAPVLTRPRLGQGAFRVLVTDAYRRRCAVTGEHTLPVLEAAHIRPFSKQGEHSVPNGLLLRSDFHKLFDIGLVTITPDRRIKISERIKQHWFNGAAYYRLDGKPLAMLPQNPADHPHPDLLRWHNENVFENPLLGAA